jgi:hypothetical protein
MLDRQVLKLKINLQGTCCFYHKKWYNMKYGLRVFRKGIVIDNDIHGERFNQLFTQMSGCNILLRCNLWFRDEDIKME